MSPPWGGMGYQRNRVYDLNDLYPNIDEVIRKSVEFSGNLMFWLPKNCDMDHLVKRLLPYKDKLAGRSEAGELFLEVEEFIFGNSCKAILVCTGKLARISHREVADYFSMMHCSNYTNISGSRSNKSMSSSQRSEQDEGYLKQLLANILKGSGYHHVSKHMAREGASKLSLQKVVRNIQKQFSDSEWDTIKRAHKKTTSPSSKKKVQRAVIGSKSLMSSQKTVS
mmetsp:Transcript_37023/g.56771  ORF Transcript_37023/g.56771 Transcript_37023/m.56771 type:complete len:224 (-) Transcript_37023:837-1508(-)